MPYFSIVLFTKNRSEIVGYALESVLRQTFQDFEIVVSDNDDSPARTAEAVRRFNDPRIKHEYTGGNLSMMDNWEKGIERACGEFVLSLTDRCVLKSFALERIFAAINEFKRDVYVWPHDVVSTALDQFWFAPRSHPEIVTSVSLFDLFLTTGYTTYETRLPRSLNSCCARSVLDDVRRTTGRVFHSVSPDFTFAFLTLALRSEVVAINHPLFVWGFGDLSNGGGSYAQTDTFRRFMRDANLTQDDLMNHVPLKTFTIHNSLCNDLLKLKAIYPDLFADIDLRLKAYFLTCLKEIREFNPTAETDWQDALSLFPDVERDIHAELNPYVDPLRRVWRKVFNSRPVQYALRRHVQSWPSFSNILEASRWVESR